MNALALPAGTPLTMSSQEIAALVEARHDNVKRTVERLAERGTIQLPPLEEVRNQQGQAVSVYQLGKRDSYVVVAQLSPEFTARLVDRWQELEAGAPVALDLRQPAQLLAVAAQLTQMCQEQQAQLAAQAPKVQFAEAVAAADADQKLAVVAKAIGAGPRKLLQFLKDRGVLMRNGLPFQQHIDRGRFRVIEVPFKDQEGKDRVRPETRVTGRGITFVQQLVSRGGGPAHA